MVVEGEGLPQPYILGVDSHCPGTDCREFGFDGTMTFAPQPGLLPGGAIEAIANVGCQDHSIPPSAISSD
jgi:hypothetical protein